uniref:Uncharacterized protein n=1 Tax=Rhodnius prolixus TaxID=13249 RepID=T1H840_RHOPR
MWLEVVLLFGVLWLIYKQWITAYSYWQERGFPYVKGKFPFGSYPNNIFFTDYFGKVHQQLYKELDPHPIGGFYLGRKPELLARDPEIIKKILVKDFANFKARNDIPTRGILSKHLFNIDGDLWRALRIKLTPTFTSGKLKAMFFLFQECSNKLGEHFKQIADNDGEIEVKDWMARFTTDIICSCAFGLEVNSIDRPDNELRVIGQNIFLPYVPIRFVITRFLLSIIPFSSHLIRIRSFSKTIENGLLSIIKETVNYREQNNISRNDFLDLLIDIKNKDTLNEHRNLSMHLGLMTAQCFVFFAAGFETSSSVLSYCLYELTVNEDIQDKVRSEVDEVLKRHNNVLSYQAYQEMTYLEQVLYETMRKYPTLPFLTRVCTKRYKIPDTNQVIEKGVRVFIPLYAIHHDPKYFPEPEKFLPERFSPENKSSIPPFVYLPFGEGPRICIGMRFGMLQTKTGIASIISKYKLLKTANTPDQLSFLATGLITGIKDNLTIKIVHRSKC